MFLRAIGIYLLKSTPKAGKLSNFSTSHEYNYLNTSLIIAVGTIGYNLLGLCPKWKTDRIELDF